MIITCIGHAKFLLELENGMRIVTDPYDAPCGYPVTEVTADAVLVSHGHHDHNAVDTVSGDPRVIDQPGRYELAPGVALTAVEACHDDQGGTLRGKTLLFVLEAEGLRVMHLGDLGHLPTAEQLAALGDADVVMIPVGGHYTIGPEAARDTAKLLHARVILPMHYKTAANPSWPIMPVTEFTRLYHEPAEVLTLLRVAKGDLVCQPHVAVLSPVSLANTAGD